MAPLFLCDAMLAKLARWLRMFGYDTELASSDEPDKQILERARVEGRTVLTRDKKLGEQEGVVLFNTSDNAEQMRVLVKKFGIELSEYPLPLFCSLCNGRLRNAEAGELPKYISKGWVCVDCGQQYWEGAHWRGIRKFIEGIKS